MVSPVDIRVGFFLAVRQLRRASFWTTGLIVFVMLLTFLNLVVVTGMLVGIVQGISDQYRTQDTGDVIVSALDEKDFIENSPQVIAFIKSLPGVAGVTARYVANGTLEANYLSRDVNAKPNKTGVVISGIDAVAENSFSDLSKYVHEGAYLSPGDYDEVLLGPQLIDRYSFGQFPGLTPLRNVYPGTKVRLVINGNTREVIVKGILSVPANSPLAMRAFMPSEEVRMLMGRTDYAVNEIAILLTRGTDPSAFRDVLKRSGIGANAKIRTFDDAMPNGIADVKNTFALIGDAISSVGLVVAAITIFIVIFINAVTRRKFIGILKGIGISGAAIESAYVFQSLFYAAIGAGVGLLFLYGFLVPYVGAHPIVLPISNAIIVAPWNGTLIRIVLLVAATIVAGYLPSRMIVRKNTLNSILGRN
ncbi:hypothetical protein KGM48_02015 [Patescibacteria group bacterium]|nr:hypothetical protein [Patescibacteria group bacterium]